MASSNFSGPLTVDIESNDGSTIYTSATINSISTSWQQYSVTLTTGNVAASKTNRFVISAAQTGTVWFNLVSLFPPTWNNRTNGLRPDLMQLLSNMQPTFLRFPGGNFLEGETLADYFPWDKSIGALSQRPGHNDPWGYRSSDGLGLLEYLTWCEDLNLSPVLAVYAGYALNGTYVTPGTTAFDQIIQYALNEIEYAVGSTSTTWGAQRAADGHPNPFTIEYVEVGNEDFLDKSGSYDARFAAIYDAIKAAYPNIKVIATATVTSRIPDVYDQHYYPSPSQMVSDSTLYNTYSRSAPKIFVGEYAAQEGKPTPDLNSALGDAAFLTGLERNSDVVVMSCYAPLFANVNAINWNTNLIGYDALNSYGSPSYYMLGMFSQYHGNTVIPTQLSGTSGLYFSTSKNTSNGTLYIKVVNPGSITQNVRVVVNTGQTVKSTGSAIVLSSGSPSDTNTLSNPAKIVPVTKQLSGLSSSFNYSFAPYSITVLVLTLS
jgi:alpha-L-arabinofuranosidase